MIRNKTARELLYAWHVGQWSPFYAAASSGLVESFTALADECMKINEPDRAKLMSFLQHHAMRRKDVIVNGRTYAALPWSNHVTL